MRITILLLLLLYLLLFCQSTCAPGSFVVHDGKNEYVSFDEGDYFDYLYSKQNDKFSVVSQNFTSSPSSSSSVSTDFFSLNFSFSISSSFEDIWDKKILYSCFSSTKYVFILDDSYLLTRIRVDSPSLDLNSTTHFQTLLTSYHSIYLACSTDFVILAHIDVSPLTVSVVAVENLQVIQEVQAAWFETEQIRGISALNLIPITNNNTFPATPAIPNPATNNATKIQDENTNNNKLVITTCSQYLSYFAICYQNPQTLMFENCTNTISRATFSCEVPRKSLWADVKFIVVGDRPTGIVGFEWEDVNTPQKWRVGFVIAEALTVDEDKQFIYAIVNTRQTKYVSYELWKMRITDGVTVYSLNLTEKIAEQEKTSVLTLGALKFGKVQLDYYKNIYFDYYSNKNHVFQRVALSACATCKDGYYSAANNSDFCSACPIGSQHNSDRTGCTTCMAGTYNTKSGSVCYACAPGSYSRANETNLVCRQCNPGTASPFYGTPEQCPSCIPGTFQPQQGAHNCRECPKGFVNSEYGAVSIGYCIDCPTGYYANGTAASSCLACPSGTYLPELSGDLGADSVKFCLNCTKGNYRPETAGFRREACIPCKPGSFAENDGSSGCQLCPAGTWSNRYGSFLSSECQPCPAATWSNVPGLDDEHKCIPCEGGYFSATAGASSILQCQACPPGTFSYPKSTACLPCKPGTYSNQYATANKCFPIPEGAIAINNSTDYVFCPTGTYANEAVSCSECLTGHSCVNGTLIACKPGTFMNVTGQSHCEQCPKGFFADTPGSTSCDTCSDGMYADTQGSPTCKRCELPYTIWQDDHTACSPVMMYIILGSIGGLILILVAAMCAIGCIAIACCHKYQQSKRPPSPYMHLLDERQSQAALYYQHSMNGFVELDGLGKTLNATSSFKKNNSSDSPVSSIHSSVSIGSSASFHFGSAMIATATGSIMLKSWEIDFNELTNLQEIAVGGSGAVIFKANWKGRKVAVKVFRTNLMSGEEQDTSSFDTELNALLTLRDKNIIYFYGACLRPPRICLVTEYCSNGTLRQYFQRNKGRIRWEKKLSFCLEVAKGLLYLHGMKVIHRDLKADNILVDDDLHAKITDFGISKILFENQFLQTKYVGTSQYMAPEIVMGKPYDEKCDVFSYGILMYELLTENFHPYKTNHQKPKEASTPKSLTEEGSPLLPSSLNNISPPSSTTPSLPQYYSLNIEYQVASNPSFRPVIPSGYPQLSSKEEQFIPWTEQQQEFIQLMTRCWSHEPNTRPAFDEVAKVLTKLQVKEG